MTQALRISHARLREIAARLLQGLGTPREKAELVADSLAAANLRGVDSHGVHLLSYYAEHLRRGLIDARADGRVVSESGACLLFDGERAFGQWVSAQCCDRAVRLAREHGLGMAVARNSNHFGAAAYWGQRISRHGMIGMVMSNASPSVPPWQGREGRIGTNPICVSLPSAGRGAWLLDMATTTVAKNRILRAEANNEPTIPPGWAMDEEGVPTTETKKAKLLMPLGGYKGSGLGLLCEILSGVLGGGAIGLALGGTYLFDRPMRTSHMFLAIEVERFLPLEEFQQRMERLVAEVKSSAPARGYHEVLVAGEPEQRIEQERLRKGVPVDPGTWEALVRLAREAGVELEP